MTMLYLLSLICALISLIMIIGGFLLLFKKVIKLEKSADKGAAELQFKELKLSTTYPALGIFVLGLAPILLSLILAVPSQDKYEINGKIVEIDNFEDVSVIVELANWHGGADSEGKVEGTILPDRLNVRITCPGYAGYTKIVNTRWSLFRSIKLGDVTLTRAASKPNRPSKIVTLNRPLPNISQAGAF